MKVAIHQPEHFPYLGFFQKMSAADIFVILDDVQYSKGGWQNRNKILNNSGEKEFFTVQVEPKAWRKLIKNVKVADGNIWRRKIVVKLKQNLGEDFSYIYHGDFLLPINMKSIYWATKRLNINTPIVFSSSLNIKTVGTQRLIDICHAVNGDEYISGMCGKNYLDKSLFTDIKLTYFEPDILNNLSAIYNICKGIV